MAVMVANLRTAADERVAFFHDDVCAPVPAEMTPRHPGGSRQVSSSCRASNCRSG